LYDYVAKEDGDLSFKAGEVIEVTDRSGDGNFWEGRTKDGRTGYFPVVLVHANNSSSSPAKSTGTLSRAASVNAKDQSGRDGSAMSLKSLSAMMGAANATITPAPQADRVRAIAGYTASVKGELTFAPGDIIEITSRDIGSDSWWEGKCNGQVGQFPKVSLLDMLLQPDDEELI
jgi:hypothetical protein